MDLGRIQGGGFFYSSAESGTTIKKSTIKPTDIEALIGDNIVFSNGDVRTVISKNTTDVTCGVVVTNLKGPSGSIEVVDNLTSTSATAALSAYMGKVLNVNKLNLSGGKITGNLDIQGNLTVSDSLEYKGQLIDDKFQEKLIGTQTTGQNIKTVNGTSLLGTGNISIPKGDPGPPGGTGPRGPAGPQPALNNTLTSTSTSVALTANMGRELNNNMVKITGNQSIGGTKTFTSAVVVPTVTIS